MKRIKELTFDTTTIINRELVVWDTTMPDPNKCKLRKAIVYFPHDNYKVITESDDDKNRWDNWIHCGEIVDDNDKATYALLMERIKDCFCILVWILVLMFMPLFLPAIVIIGVVDSLLYLLLYFVTRKKVRT